MLIIKLYHTISDTMIQYKTHKNSIPCRSKEIGGSGEKDVSLFTLLKSKSAVQRVNILTM